MLLMPQTISSCHIDNIIQPRQFLIENILCQTLNHIFVVASQLTKGDVKMMANPTKVKIYS